MRTIGERLPPRLAGLVSYAEVAGLYATEWQRRGISRKLLLHAWQQTPHEF